MNILLTRLWQEPAVVRNIVLHPHLQDVDSVLTNDLLYTLRVDGGIAAYAVVRRGKRVDRLKSVFTFPEYRGRGMATSLLKAVLDEAHQPLLLTCKEHMVRFYARLGFLPSSSVPWFVRLRLLFCNNLLATLYPHRWFAMTFIPRKRHDLLSARPKLYRRARQHPSIR